MAANNEPGRRRAPLHTCGLPPALSSLQERHNSSFGPTSARGSVHAPPPTASPLHHLPPAPKALTKQDLAAYAQQKKLERQQRREEEAARLRASKLAALADGATLPHAHMLAPGATSRGVSQPELAAVARSIRGGSKATLPLSHSSSGSGSHNGLTSRHGEERHSVSSAAVPVPPTAHMPGKQATAAGPQPAQAQAPCQTSRAPGHASRSSKWSPRKLPQAGRSGEVTSSAREDSRPLLVPSAAGTGSAAAEGLQPPSSGLASRQARELLPVPSTGAAASTARASRRLLLHQQAPVTQPACVAAPAADCEQQAVVGLEAGAVEACRMQQLVDWGAFLVQAAASEAAELVLLGPAARRHSREVTALQPSPSPGQHLPPTSCAHRATALSGVMQAVAALATQRQLKQQLAAGGNTGASDAAWQQVLGGEAAADLQAQGLLAHWGLHAACEARRPLHVRGLQM